MNRHSPQIHMEESSKLTRQDDMIMLKIAELLMKEQLISPEEKARLTELIRKDAAI